MAYSLRSRGSSVVFLKTCVDSDLLRRYCRLTIPLCISLSSPLPPHAGELFLLISVSSGVCRRIPSSARERVFFRLAKAMKQAMLVLSSIQPDNSGCLDPTVAEKQLIKQFKKTSRLKPDRVLRQAPRVRKISLVVGYCSSMHCKV